MRSLLLAHTETRYILLRSSVPAALPDRLRIVLLAKTIAAPDVTPVTVSPPTNEPVTWLTVIEVVSLTNVLAAPDVPPVTVSPITKAPEVRLTVMDVVPPVTTTAVEPDGAVRVSPCT